MASTRHSRAALIAALRQMQMQPVESEAVRRLGFDPGLRMVGVIFTSGEVRYGYPNLTDEEVRGLLSVMESHASLGHYVSTVIKPRHDFEHVRADESLVS